MTRAESTLTGTVLEQAAARCTPAGEWLLYVDFQLDSAPDRKPTTARAIKPYGNSYAAAEVCRQTAHLLRRGVRISVAHGTANWRAQRLELGNVASIRTDVPTFIRPFN
jgi:hypothetical protein